MLYACQPSEDLDAPAPVPLEIGMVQTAGIGLIDTRTATDADTHSIPDADTRSTTDANTRSATGADTRATTYSNYPTTSGSYIGFYVKAVSGAYKEVTNRRGVYVPARKVWAPSSGATDASADSIWLKEQTTNIAVYAPYAAAQDTPGKLELTPRRITGTEAQKAAADFLWYTRFEANRTNAHRSTLKLEHAYSRFTIRVSRVSYYWDPLQLGTLSLKSPGIYPAGKQVLLDLFAKPTPTYQLAEGAAGEFSVDVNEKLNQAITENTQVVDIDLLMIPVTLTQYILLSLGVDGQNMKVGLDKASFDGKFEAGKHYTLNLKLHPRELEVTGVTITDWETSTTLEGGKNDFEFHKDPGIHVLAEDIYLKNPSGNPCSEEVKQKLGKLVWAAGNLETAVGPMTTGGSMTFPKYEWASRQYDPGYYYMWQSPYLETGVEERLSENIDPCTLLNPDKYGTGWRLPTIEEMGNLLKCSMDGFYKIPTGGQYPGRWCMREVNGVFLPHPGRAQGSNVIKLDDSSYKNSGYYWCAEESSPTEATLFQITRNKIQVTQVNTSKEAGNSVRCVKDYQPVP